MQEERIVRKVYSAQTVKLRRAIDEQFRERYARQGMKWSIEAHAFKLGLRFRLNQDDYPTQLPIDVALDHVLDHLFHHHADSIEVQDDWSELPDVPESELDRRIATYKEVLTTLVIQYAQTERLKKYLRAPFGDQNLAINSTTIVQTDEMKDSEAACAEAMASLFQGYCIYSRQFGAWRGLLDGPVKETTHRLGWY